MDPKCLPSEKLFDQPGGEIASLNPNDLGWRTQALGQIHEIQIGADHGRKLLIPRPIEDGRIGRSDEIVIVHGLESGKDVRQFPN
jgi:hypothetical protein